MNNEPAMFLRACTFIVSIVALGLTSGLLRSLFPFTVASSQRVSTQDKKYAWCQ